MTTPSLQSLLWTLVLASLARVQAATRIVIVDDADVDQIIYSPTGWNIGNQCPGCSAQPDEAKAFNGTWHDGTESGNRLDPVFFTFNFTGTSIETRYTAIDIKSLWTTNTNITYSIDGEPSVVKQRAPTNATDYLYDQVLFRIDGLSNVAHTLHVHVQRPGVLLFDYLMYTEESVELQTTTSQGGYSSSPKFATDVMNVNVVVIIGGVLSGFVVLVIAFASWCYLRRRRRRAQVRLEPVPIVHGPVSRPPPKLEGPSRGLTKSALVSLPAVPPPPDSFPSQTDNTQIISPPADEPVEQGLMSMGYSP